MTTRSREHFREGLYHSWSADELRIMPPWMIERFTDDPDKVNNIRMDIYRQQRQGIDRMVTRSGSQDMVEKSRAKDGRYNSGDPSDLALSDNIAEIYFNFYGENFEGGTVVDNFTDGYTCPWCKIHYQMSLKLMPEHCLRCGALTPLGRLRKDGAFNR